MLENEIFASKIPIHHCKTLSKDFQIIFCSGIHRMASAIVVSLKPRKLWQSMASGGWYCTITDLVLHGMGFASTLMGFGILSVIDTVETTYGKLP